MEVYASIYEDIVSSSNIVKDLIFEKLEADGVIDSAQVLKEQYIVLPVKRGLFGQIYAKFMGDNNDLRIKVVKVS